jgi:hypothetical protein
MVLQHRQQDAVAGLEIGLPQVCATRLIASVAPRVNTISPSSPPSRPATLRRAASKASVMSAERV